MEDFTAVVKTRGTEFKEKIKLKMAQVDVQKMKEAMKMKMHDLGRLNVCLLVTIVLLVVCIITMAMSNGNAKAVGGKMRMKRNVDTVSGEFVLAQKSTFVRWGRKTCPNDDPEYTVYEGIAGGEHYSHTGGGNNYLCLPHDPDYEVHNGGTDAIGGYVYGAEYEFLNGKTNNFPFSSTDSKGSLKDHNVPCTVCIADGPVMMIPAKNQCPSGWNKEYSGYLSTEHYAHTHSRNFVCLDHDIEPVDAGFVNENGALFFKVEGRCGSLPCPKYNNGWELTCVVCSKILG